MFSFQHPEYLLVLLALPLLGLLYFLALVRKKKVAKKIGDPHLIKMLTSRFSQRKFNIKFFLVALAFAAGVIAFTNIRMHDDNRVVTRNGIDVMIALDVSNSMLAQDVAPSRLERAKQFISKLIDRLKNDRIGIVVFAGKAYLQMPLTSDHGAAKMYLASASPDLVPTQGTVIGEALKMCNFSFNEKETKYKAVILISDGEDHDEGAVQQAAEMYKSGVVIHSVGIGSPQGATIPDPGTGQFKTDVNGNIVYSKLNEQALKAVSDKTNGSYQLYTSTDVVASNILSDLSAMDKRAVTDESLMNFQSYFQVFLGLMLLLLLADFFVNEYKKKKKKVAVSITMLLMFSASVYAQDPKQLIKEGNEAYSRKDYAKAEELYKKASADKESGLTASYNLGNAAYRNSKTEEALKAYDQVLTSSKNPAEQEAVLYNKGVVYQNNKKFDECIDAYKRALKIDPNDDDARQNLQKALREKKQKEQQKQQNKQDQKKQQQQKQQSKMNQSEAEQRLQALAQQEKNLHEKLKKANANSVNKPDKDW